jgi:hypothetical protein
MLRRILSFVSGVVETGVSRLSFCALRAFAGSLLGLALPAVVGIAFCTTANATGLGPIITVPPVSQSVTLGSTATFSVTATGTPTLTYAWQYLDSSAIWQPWTVGTGYNTPTYTTLATTAAYNGLQIRVVVTDGNSLSTPSDPVTLTVNSPPVINTQPVSQSVTLGSTATFSVTATGTPTLTYAWQYLNGSGVWMPWAVGTGYNTPTFTTLATTAAYNGLQIRVVVTDGNSLSTPSNPVTLTVNSPPVINTQPVSQSVNLGSSATFSVTATGTPTLTYAWQYLKIGSVTWKSWAVGTGYNTPTFTTLPTNANYNGIQFRVVVTDGNGLSTPSNPVTLIVNLPPVINTQPVSQNVTVGNTATFSVTATGTPTLTYAWQYLKIGSVSWKSWAVGTGYNTPTYTTLATTTAFSGLQIRVVVTDGNGLSTTSNPVTLTVNSSPLVTVSPTSLSFGNVAVGSTSAAKTVTLFNNQTTPLTISAIAVPLNYSVSAPTCVSPMSAGASCTISVTLTPSTLGALPPGQLTITDSTSPGLQAVTLTGTGITPLTLPSPTPSPLQPGNTTQPYNGAINASGGSESGYVFTVNGTQIPISSTPTAAPNADGLTFTNNGGNTLFIGGTPSVAGTFTLNVSVTDSATDSAGPVAYTIKVINPYAGYTVSGAVNYTGSQTGWIYIKLSNSNCNDCGGPGTAIPAKGSFTINGVQDGTYQLQAFMDNMGYGAENASNPTGSISSVVVADGTVSNVSVTLADPSPVTLGSTSPTISQASGFSGGAFISLNNILQNNNGIETATSYNIRWSTSSSFSPVVGSTSFAATGGQNPWIVSGISGCATCYFEVQGVAGSSTTNWSGSFGPVTIGAPTGGNTVSGTVTLPSAVTPKGPLYVGFYDQNSGNVYVTVITSPSSSTPNAYSVQVPTGFNYYFFGILDQNNNGLMNLPGEISNTNENNNTAVVIDPSNPSTLTQNLILPATGANPTNSIAQITTQHQQQINSNGTSDYYQVDLRVDGQYKLPVAVQLTAAPNPGAVIPADYATGAFSGNTDEFDMQPNLNGSTPKVGDSYNLLVTYSDSTAETLTVTIPSGGVLNAFATLISPASQATGVSTTPNFSWTDPSPSSSYQYQFQLWDSNYNTIWQISGKNQGRNGFSNSITSLTWAVDPTGSGSLPSVPSLNSGSTYTWQIQAYDANGNSSQMQVNFETAEPSISLPPSGTMYATVGQYFSKSLNVSGGSGSGYAFTVNSSTGVTSSGITTWTLADGLTASSTVGSNTLTVSGTPISAQLVPLSISVTDSASDTAGPVTYGINVYNQGTGTTATGNVGYGGTQTGWVYLSLSPTNNCNNIGCSNPNPGTALSAATLASGGAFTIHGVQPGTYTLQAWMDTLGYGVQNAADPSGSTPVTVTSSTLSGVSVTLNDPGPVTLTSAPTWDVNLGVGAFSGGAMVYFDSILNSNGAQMPTSYILEYSTDSTFNTGVSSKSFPAAHADHHWIVTGLTNGATYYFRAAGVVGSGSSAVIGPWSPASPTGGLTIGAPTGPNTIQGTVTFSGTATGPLYVGLIDVGLGNNNIFAQAIQNPVSPQAYSVQVPSGSEFVFFGIIDQNNDGWNGPGDISNFGGNGPPPVYVNGSMSGVNLTLPSSNSVVVLDTENRSEADENYTGGGYNLLTVVSAAGKLPVAAELLSGPNVIAPEDLAVCGTCSLQDRFYSVFTPGSAPTVGDPYKLQVTYSDGSSETLKLAVSGVVPLLTNLAPSGIGGTSTTPTFTWTDPANASNYDYQFVLYNQNYNVLWVVPKNFTGLSGFPSSITSIPWGSDPTGANNPPSVSSLTSGEVYYWQVGATDVYGNWSQTFVDYVPGYTPLYLPTPNPPTLGTATVGYSYTGTITVVGGYGTYSWVVNGCSWNCNVSIGNGLTASYTGLGNNTLTISGSPTATGQVSFTVKVEDLVGNIVGAYTYTINIINAANGYKVSGTVTYPGSKTGWVYVGLAPCSGCSPSYGTAINATTAHTLQSPGVSFTIHGVQPGTYTLQAWMDNLGNGAENASNPTGSTSNVTVTSGNLSGTSITLTDPATVTLGTFTPGFDSNNGLGVFNGGAVIGFDPIYNSNGIEMPTSYNLQYSTSSDFSSGVTTMSFPANNQNSPWIVTGLTNGQTYYFRAAGVVGSTVGNYSAAEPTGGLTIGAPSAGSLLSGTVTFTLPTGVSASGKTLYAGCYAPNTGVIYADPIASPVSPQSYSVYVPNGTNCYIFGFIDLNNTGLIGGSGEISNTNNGQGMIAVTVNGTTPGQNITLPSGNSVAQVQTSTNSSVYGTSYGVGFKVYGQYKLPVAVELLSETPEVPGTVADVALPADIATGAFNGDNDEFYYWPAVTGTPVVGDSYKFNVTYSDGTSEQLTAAVTGVLTSLPTNLSPQGTGSNNLTPNFSWTDPTNASNYTYQFQLQDVNSNTIWQIPSKNSSSNGFPSTITSITWGVDPTGSGDTPSVSSLTLGEQYTWQIQAQDIYGNTGQTQVYYYPGYTALALPAPSSTIPGPAVAGQLYTGTIAATGGYPCYSYQVSNFSGTASVSSGYNYSYGGSCNSQLTIHFTPNTTGTITFTVTVNDSHGNTASQNYSVAVNTTILAPVKLIEPSGETAFVNQPFTETISASGGSGCCYSFWVGVNGATSNIVPTSPSVLPLTDNLSATINGNDQLIISGTPTNAATISLAIHVADNQGNNISQPESLSVVAAPSGVNNSNLKGTYVCKVDGFNDNNGPRLAFLASIIADGNGNLSDGVWDNNSRVYATAASGTIGGTYSIGSDNNGLMITSGTLTSGGSGSFTNTWAIALSNAGEPASPAQEFRMVETDDVGANASGQHGTGDCYLATTGAFAASTIGSNGFAFGIQGEDQSGNPKAYVGRFTAVTGSSGGTISAGIVDGMTVNQSGDEGGTITGGSYTVPDSTTGRFTFSLSFGSDSGNFVGYIIDAKRMFILSTDAATSNGLMGGDMRTQQQSTYTGANINGNFVTYEQGYEYSSASGRVTGYDAIVMQTSGDGTGSYTVNQSYQNENGTYQNGKANGVTASLTFDTNNPGRAAITVNGSGDTTYLYFFNTGSAFLIDFEGSEGYLATGWVEPQTQTTFTNAALAGNYLFGQMPLMIPTMSGNVREWNFDNAGNITGDSSSGGPGVFTYDVPVASTTYAWLSTTNGTFSANTSPTNRSCAVISSTRAVCIGNTTTTPAVIILQQ